MFIIAVDWSEVTAIATAVLALSLLGAIGAAVFAAQQVREARRSREAQMAAEFFRRWNEDALVEARQMVGRFQSAEELRDAFVAYVAADAPEAYVLYRELDYFEQLAALESRGAFDLELIRAAAGAHADRALGDVEAGAPRSARAGRVPDVRGARREAEALAGSGGRRGRMTLAGAERPSSGNDESRPWGRLSLSVGLAAGRRPCHLSQRRAIR